MPKFLNRIFLSHITKKGLYLRRFKSQLRKTSVMLQMFKTFRKPGNVGRVPKI